MPLKKAKGNMYPWVTHTHSLLAGACPHQCRYCYVHAVSDRFGNAKYSGEPRLVEKEEHVSYGKNKTIFIEHCSDLFAYGIPGHFISRILDHCRKYPENTYVFQTKNPCRMTEWIEKMPPKRILGCTIETIADRILQEVSSAPTAAERISYMKTLRMMGESTFITIEPILRGDMNLLAWYCSWAGPEFVNIGADSKGHGLPEPTARDVENLIKALKTYNIDVRLKTNLDRILKGAAKGD